MGIVKTLRKIKDYYNKDSYTISITYKGIPMSATGNSEDSVNKSISYLKDFVDYGKNNHLSKT